MSPIIIYILMSIIVLPIRKLILGNDFNIKPDNRITSLIFLLVLVILIFVASVFSKYFNSALFIACGMIFLFLSFVLFYFVVGDRKKKRGALVALFSGVALASVGLLIVIDSGIRMKRYNQNETVLHEFSNIMKNAQEEFETNR